MADRVGQHVGNYLLVKLLGRGGCAEVYLGKHRYLKSYAALKVLNVKIRPGDEHQYLTEAQTLVDLRHPQIVHLLDFVIEGGTPVLIMDYAPKGSLRQSYPQGTPIPLIRVIDFVAQIAAALQYAHNHHIVHRDVKPENILLDANNRLLLSDFGLSLLAPPSEQLSTQDPAGTARYMAPEQLHGKPCFASDQYALAVMVYEWLCGSPPFRGTPVEIWHQHLYADPPRLSLIRPELSLKVEKVLQRSLAKKPQDRFVSIQAFAWALAQAGQSDPHIDEHASQVTAPMQVLARSSLTVPPYYAPVFLPQNVQQAQMLTGVQASAVPEQLPPLAFQNRVRMLRRLYRSYTEMMSQSLQGAAWLELGIAEKPDAVQNATNLLLCVERRADRHLSPGTSIVQAYDEAEHELLILGEPGAGKSTLLLDLAQRLLTRAEQDQTHPLPVILPLSSWAVERPRLEDWIAEQLAEIYDVPHKLSEQWVREGRILPLLDGLDEMEEMACPACVAAINTYHRNCMAQLVVCSRTTEYEVMTTCHRLALQRAVVVQPLTHENVDAYLVQAGKPLTDLRIALKKHTALRDLATTPLMLNILILTYQGTSVGDLSDRETLLLSQVWDDYVQRMVVRKGDSVRYPLGQTRAWLTWMAQHMRDHNQTVFYLEHLQPDWLNTYQKRIYTWHAVRLPALVIGVLVSMLLYLFVLGHGKLAGLLACLKYGSQGGLLGGTWHRPLSKKGNLGEHRHGWRKPLVKRFALSACIGLIAGLSLAYHLSSYFHYTFSQWQTPALSYAVVMGLSNLFLQYLLTVPFHPGMSFGNSGPRWWKRVVRLGSAVQGPRALLVAVVIGLSNALTITQFYEPTAGLKVGLIYGIAYGLISLALRAQTEDVLPTERLRWSRGSLRRGLFNSRHIRVTGLLCIITVFTGQGQGLAQGLSVGLSVGLTYWCLLGLFQGIAQEQIENRDRRVANQGIHRSLRNSVMMGIIGGVMSGIIGILNYWLTSVLSSGLNSVLKKIELISGLNSVLSYGQKIGWNSELSSVLSNYLLLGICGALLISLLTGGLAVLRHYIIRLLLWRTHTFPWRAPQFLDDATARSLLRRVGGGYSFTHRLLLDHLADATEHNGDQMSA